MFASNSLQKVAKMKRLFFFPLVVMLAAGCVSTSLNEDQQRTSESIASGTMSSAATLAAQGTSYRLANASAQLIDGLLRVDVSIAASSNPLDVFHITRVSTPLPLATHRGSVLLLPSRNCNAVEYEWTDPGVGYRQSPAGYLADHGYDVWLFSPRTTSLSPGACVVAGSCSIASSWGMNTYISDIDFERSVMEFVRPSEKPFVGGLSLGGMLTYATINAHPYRYAGAIVWEALLSSKDAAFQAGFGPICSHDQTALVSGQTVDDGFGLLAGTAYTLATTAPAALSPLGIFPGFDNQQTFVGLFAIPNPALPIPVRGFIINASDPTSVYERFAFTNDYREGKQINTGNYYESVHLERDFDCSFAGVETSFTNHLGAFIGPILGVEAGLGFGTYMNDNLSLFGSTDRTIIFTPNYGHADHLLSTNYKNDIVLPILNWLNSHTI